MITSLFLLVGVIGAIAFVILKRNMSKDRNQLGQEIPPWPISFFLRIFIHFHVGKLARAVRESCGPIVQAGLGPVKVILISQNDLIKGACNLPSLSGRGPCLFKEVLEDGLLWNDIGAAKRKFIFRNTRHFALGGTSAEENIHEEITMLFKTLDHYNGQAIVTKGIFNIPTMNGVFRRLLGERVPHDDIRVENLIKNLNEDLHGLGNLFNGSRMVELPKPLMRLCFFVPSLAHYIPGRFSGLKLYRETAKGGFDIVTEYLEKHKSSRIANEPRDFLDSLFDEVEATTDPDSVFHSSRDPIPALVFDLVSAAIETIGNVLEWIVLYLLHFPDIQDKLRDEVIHVIGDETLPKISHRSQMPYIQAFLQEIFRVAVATPFGYHWALEDTHFRGYFIKKGTYVISNFYCVQFDCSLWKEPEKFMPERFIDENTGQFIKSENIFAFGWGKRNCVGEVTARDQLFLYLTRILQVYDLVPSSKLPPLDSGDVFVSNHSPRFEAKFARRIS